MQDKLNKILAILENKNNGWAGTEHVPLDVPIVMLREAIKDAEAVNKIELMNWDDDINHTLITVNGKNTGSYFGAHLVNDLQHLCHALNVNAEITWKE